MDVDYRSDTSHFYARAFRPPPNTTERLIFASSTSSAAELVGAAVVRPLPQQVGRTMLAPPLDLERYITCTAAMPVHAFGFDWTVTGFPFTSQDGEYGVCAHAAIWAIARYHHLRFGTDKHTISSIIEAAGLRERPDRTARSEGLYATEIVRAFRGIGLPALQYSVEGIETPENVHTVACRYLNSGIPVAVVTKNHMKILVGYGEAADGSIFYIVSDDNYSPYQPPAHVHTSGTDEWMMLVIPQPGRMHVNGEAGEARAQEAFEDRVRANVGPGHVLARWSSHELRVRTYATPSARYIRQLGGRGMPAPIRDHHVYAPKGNWLWVTEFQDTSQPEAQRVLGEIAIDATSLQLDPSPIFGNIDGWAYVWHPDSPEPSVVQAVADGAAFRSALGDRSEQPPPPMPPQLRPLGGRTGVD